MTEDTRAGRAMPPSRVHQLARLRRPELIALYCQLHGATVGPIADAVASWSVERLIDNIITLEITRAAARPGGKVAVCQSA